MAAWSVERSSWRATANVVLLFALTVGVTLASWALVVAVAVLVLRGMGVL